MSEAEFPLHDAIHSLAHTVESLLPLLVLCKREDVLCECKSPFETRLRPPRLILTDRAIGGSGISDQVFDHVGKLLNSAYLRLSECACNVGCPACTVLSLDPPRSSSNFSLL